MRRISLTFGLLLLSLAVPELHGQNPTRTAATLSTASGRIVGSVVAAGSDQPLGAAAVTIRSASDSVVVAGTMTARDGRFRVGGLPFGQYMVRVSVLGYRPLALALQTLTAAAPVMDVGVVRLEIAPLGLDAVEANAERSPIVLEADRTVYNTKDLATAAGNATDVLRSVPELEVDLNGRISLRGSQGVAVYVNGRPSALKGEALTTFLQQLPGSRVSRIEVMPNPSARHDPEGMGGIVNIVLRDDVSLGLSGSVSLNGNSRTSRGLSGRINYQKGRFTLFSGGSWTFSNQESSNHELRQNLLTQPTSYLDQKGVAQNEGLLRGFDMTAELRVGDRAHFWTTAWLYRTATDSRMLTEYGLMDDAHTLLERYDRDNKGDWSYGTGDFAVGFKQVFGQRHEFTVDVRRVFTTVDSDGRFTRVMLQRQGIIVQQPPELTQQDFESQDGDLALQADYTRPFLGGGKLDLGMRIVRRDQDEDNVMRIFADEMAKSVAQSTTGGFRQNEDFRSAYATMSNTLGKFGVQLGLRAEMAATTFHLLSPLQTFDNDYNSLFPSANLSYGLGQGRTLRFSYAKRIGRPHPSLLNPYNPSPDPLNINIGNPYLKPNYTHSFSLELSKIGQKGTIRVSPYYRRVVDNWDRIRTVDENGVSTITWENVAQTESYGTVLTASLRPTGRLSGSASLSGYREVSDASNLSADFTQSSLRWSASVNAAVRLGGSLTGTTNLRYSPAYSLVQGRVSGTFFSSVGLRRQILGTRGSINLLLTDPFDAYQSNFETRDLTHVQSSRTIVKMRTAALSISYNFGKPPQQVSRRQSDADAPTTSVVR